MDLRIFLAGATALVVTAGPVLAADYPCPTDPGFCYFDIGNDGCWDAGTDGGAINGALEAGDFNFPFPAPGSIVCPPSVEELEVQTLDNARWAAGTGGHILLYGAEISGDPLDVRLLADDGSGDVLLGNDVRVRLIVQANDVSIEQDVRDTLTVFAEGDVTVADGSFFKARSSISFFAESGEIRLGSGVKISSSTIQLIGGDIFLSGLRAVAKLGYLIRGNDLTATGYTQLKTKAGGQITMDVSGDVAFERALLKTNDISLEAASFVVTSPDGKPSRILTGKNGDLEVTTVGSVDLELVDLRVGDPGTSQKAEIEGANIALRNGKIRGRPGTPLTLTSAGTCDLTNSKVVKVDLTTACGSVVGP